MRLIDADAMIERIQYSFHNHERVRIDTVTETFLSADCSPTIEARPVVRGEWVLNKDGSGTCNQCGRTQKSVWDHDGWQNFCGHCGAEMQQGYERR